MNDDKCVHGWTSPPECPTCLLIERDALSDALRLSTDKSRELRAALDSVKRLAHVSEWSDEEAVAHLQRVAQSWTDKIGELENREAAALVERDGADKVAANFRGWLLTAMELLDYIDERVLSPFMIQGDCDCILDSGPCVYCACKHAEESLRKLKGETNLGGYCSKCGEKHAYLEHGLCALCSDI